MDDMTLEIRNREAISEAHARWLAPPPDYPIEEEDEPKSTISASQAKMWADKVFGRGLVALVNREGRILRRVGFINQYGGCDICGEGRTWDEAVINAGCDPEELQDMRKRGQG